MHSTSSGLVCFVPSQPILHCGKFGSLSDTLKTSFHSCSKPILPQTAWSPLYRRPRVLFAQLSANVSSSSSSATAGVESSILKGANEDLNDNVVGENGSVGGDSSSISAVRESLNLLEWNAVTAKVIQFATTDLGRTALLDKMVQSHLYIPSTRLESEVLLEQTREMRRLEHTLAQALEFGAASDVTHVAELASKGRVLTTVELLAIARTLTVGRVVRKQIVSTDPDTFPALHAIVSPLKTVFAAEKEILRCIDEYAEVVEAADESLSNVRGGMRAAASEARAVLTSLMTRNSDAIQDRLITTRYDRYVIPVKASHKAKFRSCVVHDTSSTGQTLYVEPSPVRPINDRLKQFVSKEKAIIQAILQRLSLKVVAPVASDIAAVCGAIAILDAAAARAHASESLNAVDVAFSEGVSLNLPAARHPLLMWAAKHSTKSTNTSKPEIPEADEPEWKKEVVPSTYAPPEGVRCVCVTGPNTGGKTLSLKTLGVCALMAKAGLLIPAEVPPSLESLLSVEKPPSGVDEIHVTIPYFDKVLADIGDDQSLVQSLSTFSGHVRRIKRILTESTPQTLVLLDEIGSGTDPAEGAALGMAVLRHLAVGNRAALTFATTHHGELKTLKYSTDQTAGLFENASVEFDDVNMKPTFRLVWGIPGRSNALAIAERLGLDEAVVSQARELLTGGASDGTMDDGTGESENGRGPRVDIERMIRSLETDKLAAEEARNEAEAVRKEVIALRGEVKRRLESLQENERKLREEQRATMDAEVKRARQEIARVIKNMQQGGGSAQAARDATEQMERLEQRRQNSPSNLAQDGRGSKNLKQFKADDISVGDRVILNGLNDGEVEVVEKVSGKEIIVAMGRMKMKVKVRDVASVRGPEASGDRDGTRQAQKKRRDFGGGENASLGSGKKPLMVRTSANTVDVRGERVEQATDKIDQALARTIGMGALWIIHGHGTGRLRSGVRAFLKDHSLVSSIQDAEQSDGGTGVTIAFL